MKIPEKTTTQAPADACKIEPPTQESRREFLLAAMRSARIRIQLLQHELDEVGIAVRFGLISPEIAVEWLHEVDVLRFVNADAWCEQAAK